MRLDLWIASRLRLGKNGSGAGSVIAVAGVAIALAVMELTCGVVVGFKSQILHKLMGFDAQITVEPPYNPYSGTQDALLTLTPGLDSVMHQALPGADIAAAWQMPGMIKTDSNFEALVFRARQPHSDFSFEKSNIVAGTWPDYTADSCANHIVVSRATATALGLDAGEKVYTAYIVDGNVKLRRNTIAGIYAANFGEYDRTVAYCSPRALQSIAGLDSTSAACIQIRNINPADIEAKATELQDALTTAAVEGRLQAYYPVDTIRHTGAVYFNWLELLNTNVAVIFALMLCVGAFTLISSLFIIVLNNVSDIGILRALGATRALVRSVFVGAGMRLVALGMAIGNVLGIGLLLVQKTSRIIPLDPEAYYLDAVPVQIDLWAMLAINIGVALASWAVLWIPARTAAGTDPAKSIKFD